MDHFEVIIVGTGAGGGTLAGTGKKILLLERGDYLRREKENWDPKAVFQDQRYVTSDLWYDAEGEEFRPEMHYYVGGQTKVYGAALLRPFPLPVALNREEVEPHLRPCIRCNTCDGFPCLADAKGDAQVVCVDEAAKQSSVTLLRNTRVTKLVAGVGGREVTQVEAHANDERLEFEGDLVVLACGAINSAALLLRSVSDRHPQGLGNSTGLVGRNLMLHNNSAMLAVSTKPNPTRFQKTLGLNDFYFATEDLPYPLGHIQLLGKSHWQMLRADAPFFKPKAVLRYMAGHSVDWWITTEDLPDPQNRVRLDCRAYDLDNLYVVDGSFFPSISSVNPALTIMANALRVTDRICERLGVSRRRAEVV